jgi:SAM-dependent methyltransferase
LASSAAAGEPAPWIDERRRTLHPLPFPTIAVHDGVSGAIPGTEMMWRYLFERGVGAHQRCLDVGCGAGTQTVQLALNGADHVHALDVEEGAVANTLANAFRNGVAESVTGEVADLYPWVPGERYEVIVANVSQIPRDPAGERSSHRPVDYWGRGLVDQLLTKLPGALALEGVALVTITSILSRIRTQELLTAHGLSCEVVAWELTGVPDSPCWHEAHIGQIEDLSDAFRVTVGDQQRLVAYLLAIRHASLNGDDPRPLWPMAQDAR